MKYLTPLYRFLICLFVLAATTLAQSATVSDRNAILYEISGNGLEGPSYIFGTIHMVCAEEMLDLEQLSPILGSTGQAVMEIDLLAAIEPKGEPPGATKTKPTSLAGIYSKEELDILDKVSREYLQIPILALNRLDPAMIQLLLLGSPKMLECAPIGSYDMAFARKFKELKTPVYGLETIDEQMSLFSAGTGKSDSAKDLLEFVSNLDKFKENLNKLLILHKNQDLEALQAEALAQMRDDTEAENKFLSARNLVWLPKLEAFIRAKPTFVAVGAAHLGGEKGVLSLLEKKGYSIKPIRLKAALPVDGENRKTSPGVRSEPDGSN